MKPTGKISWLMGRVQKILFPHPHELHQRTYMPTPRIVTSTVQLITQHPGTHKRMLQMQFVDFAHDCQIDGINRFWLIIDAATAYAD